MSRKLVEYWCSRGARCIFVVLTFVFCIFVFWYLSNVQETGCAGQNVLIVQYKPPVLKYNHVYYMDLHWHPPCKPGLSIK